MTTRRTMPLGKLLRISEAELRKMDDAALDDADRQLQGSMARAEARTALTLVINEKDRRLPPSQWKGRAAPQTSAGRCA